MSARLPLFYDVDTSNLDGRPDEEDDGHDDGTITDPSAPEDGPRPIPRHDAPPVLHAKPQVAPPLALLPLYTPGTVGVVFSLITQFTRSTVHPPLLSRSQESLEVRVSQGSSYESRTGGLS